MKDELDDKMIDFKKAIHMRSTRYIA